ncbi:addiction module toxin RelE [Candidatus Woesearchaeota archaeon]|nr:addiction module toxin RelE [Candidatus Woesearchaeota archaeon]
MAFSFDLTEELKELIIKISRRDPVRASIIYKKIEQIVSCDEKAIDHYKNLRHDLSDYKRVHIDKSFVLLFKVTKPKNHILFVSLKHHDDVY